MDGNVLAPAHARGMLVWGILTTTRLQKAWMHVFERLARRPGAPGRTEERMSWRQPSRGKRAVPERFLVSERPEFAALSVLINWPAKSWAPQGRRTTQACRFCTMATSQTTRSAIKFLVPSSSVHFLTFLESENEGHPYRFFHSGF